MKPHLHQLPELFDAAADLLDHVGDVAGLRAGLHTALPEGVRLLVQTGLPYTDEVGPLDRIGTVLKAPITHERTNAYGYAQVHGTWNGTLISGSHLYADRPHIEKPCTHPATELSRRIRTLIPWSRQSWTRWAESVHMYDEHGTPRLHVVLTPDGSLDEALAALLDATGTLQYRHERKHDYVAHGSVLLDDGTVVTASSIESQTTGGTA
ncbi:hypothetical protein ACFY12_34350 [Streptomyces sp. NPDC001339]|uniref:hypothetical protein n=1 Tax=Streptomyces sp. NPDC001339 TaxID=3364563 RepID=UPI0036983D8D